MFPQIMVPLYWLDRTLTGALKGFSTFLAEQRRITVEKQSSFLIVGLPLAAIVLSYPLRFEKSGSDGFLGLPVFLVLLGVYFMSIVVLAKLLIRLHIMLDPDGIFRPNRLYSFGHFAWSCMIMFVIYMLAAFITRRTFFGFPFFFTGSVTFALVYISFINRTGGRPNRKRRSLVTAFLEKLEGLIAVPKPAF